MGTLGFWLADVWKWRRGLEAAQLIQGDPVSACHGDECLYKYLHSPHSLSESHYSNTKSCHISRLPELYFLRLACVLPADVSELLLVFGAGWIPAIAQLGAG